MKFFKKKSVIKKERIFNICALGNTGVGKSALLNMLAGIEDNFKIGESAISETQIATYSDVPLHFLGDPSEIKLCLIDTQGLSDTGGDKRDMEHIKNMVDKIRELKYIDLFLLCLEETNPRFSDNIQNTISLFNEIFPDFLNHTVIIFNKWTTPDLSKREKLQSEYKTIFNIKYNIPNISCFFIDSFYNLKKLRDNDDGTQSEKYLHKDIQARTHEQVLALKNHLLTKSTRCDVQKIEPKETKITKLENENESIKKELNNLKENKKSEKLKKWQKIGIIAGSSSGGTIAVIIVILVAIL